MSNNTATTRVIYTTAPIHVLVATSDTQGRRSSDFCWTQENELVTFSMACDGEEIDGRCGCRRSMSGLQSLKGTTTVKVAQLPGGEEALRNELRAYLERSGGSKLLDAATIDKWIQEDIEGIVYIASSFPVGTVLEIRGESFEARVMPSKTTR